MRLVVRRRVRIAGVVSVVRAICCGCCGSWIPPLTALLKQAGAVTGRGCASLAVDERCSYSSVTLERCNRPRAAVSIEHLSSIERRRRRSRSTVAAVADAAAAAAAAATPSALPFGNIPLREKNHHFRKTELMWIYTDAVVRKDVEFFLPLVSSESRPVATSAAGERQQRPDQPAFPQHSPLTHTLRFSLAGRRRGEPSQTRADVDNGLTVSRRLAATHRRRMRVERCSASAMRRRRRERKSEASGAGAHARATLSVH